MVTVYYKSFLTDEEKMMYDRILNGVIEYEDEILLENASCESVEKIIDCINMDRPELFFVNWGMEYEYTPSYVKLLPEYRYKREEALKELRKTDSIADSLVEQVKNFSQHDAALMLHDVLAKHIVYTSYESIKHEAYTIVGALKNKKCVCEGYSRAYKYLCDKAGIPCFMVVGFGTSLTGITERHAWNMIKLSGKCYYVDVTFDSMKSLEYCSRANFLLSEEQMSLNHLPDERYSLPRCATSLNPLPVIGSLSELKTHLRRDSKYRKPYTEYRFANPVETKLFFEKYEDVIGADDLDYYKKIECFTHSAEEVIDTVGVKWKRI